MLLSDVLVLGKNVKLLFYNFWLRMGNSATVVKMSEPVGDIALIGKPLVS